MDSLFEELGIRGDVLDALSMDHTLNEIDREFALHVALKQPESPVQLNDAAWNMVKSRDAGKDTSSRALRLAEAAVSLDPENGFFIGTLGTVLYRIGHHADALAPLMKSEKLNALTLRSPHSANLAFLALTQHQLGKKDEAEATLGRLREIMKQPRWAKDAESVGFLREAEELIEGKAAGKK